MVSTRPSNKLKRAKKIQEKGEFIPIDNSDSDNDSIDWEALDKEDSNLATEPSGNVSSETVVKTPTSTAKKGQRSMPPNTLSLKRKALARRKGRGKGTEANISSTPDSSSPSEHVCVDTNRMRAFEDRDCIGERHVDVASLQIRSPEFGTLIDQAKLLPVCKFGDTIGYCLHLVRSFYANAQKLQEAEGGQMEFYTLVAGASIKITPQLIEDVLGMEASVLGIDYLKGTTLSESSLQKVKEGICLPDTPITGYSVNSRELRLEYKFLNFMVCYNILPNMQTKILRWDRMVFLYLLGHPMEAVGLNVNIPYVIWSRMARFVDHSRNPERLPFPLIIMRILRKLGVNFNVPYVIWRRMTKFVKDTHPNERLPFPLIIMRILRKFGIDTASTSSVLSSGTINASTIAKSRSSGQHETKPLKSPAAGPSAQASTSNGAISLTTIHSEQQKLSQELKAMTKKINTIYKLVKRLSATNDDALSDESGSE